MSTPVTIPGIGGAERRADEARESLAHDVEAIRERADEVASEARALARRSGAALVPIAGGAAIAVVALAAGGVLARVVKRVALGAGAGVVAALAMNQVFRFVPSGEGEGEEPSGDPPTVKAAEAVVGPIADDDKPRAGSIAHYAMAATTGAIYALAAGFVPAVTLGRGLLYGAGVWLAADEAIVPALGFAPPPWESGAKKHLQGLLAHLVYGAALDAGVRLALR